MKSNVIIQKKNEVYLTIECEPHVGHELADEFTFEVPQAKFMSAYKKRFWDGKIKTKEVITCNAANNCLKK